MTRKFLNLFAVNDSGDSQGSKEAKDEQGNEQALKTNLPPSSPNRQPEKPDGPPDLDELWRDFNNRLSSYFGAKDNANPLSRYAGYVVILLAVIMLWLGSGFYVVPEGRTGVIKTFGKDASPASVGFHWHQPWPIQSMELDPLPASASQAESAEQAVTEATPNENVPKVMTPNSTTTASPDVKRDLLRSRDRDSR
ncbi:protease modulator HflK [Polynucleobacter paludilacus]|uniref:protease modulator HflK n=1 Tax=Polynucleobacter paludilacus TaxID=1855895 RepID=UPI001BFD66F8|nr:protease modulator HflK [Polynucleobacter paludilacus]QWD87665.1 protease modulator HflK [Polynucleobacter paludilacus]